MNKQVIVKYIDDLIIDIIQKYNEDDILNIDNIPKPHFGSLYLELIKYIITLVINDLDIGKSYYTKNEGDITIEKIMSNELKLRQANESRSRMKNKIDDILLQISGKPHSPKYNIRVTNVDSFSAYIDRLTTERIKEYSFKYKQYKPEEAIHQSKIVEIILKKIINLLDEIDNQQGYEYISERRTFDENKIINDVNNVLKILK